MLRKMLEILFLSTALLTAAACNTVRGAAEDLESASNAVDEEI